MKQHALIHSLKDEVAWKALQNISQKFSLSENEILILMGKMPRSTYFKGINSYQGKLTHDQTERISYLLGIYKDLRILFTDSAQAMSWISRPNDLPPFNGITPKQYMLQGSLSRLSDVRRFLDFWRGH